MIRPILSIIVISTLTYSCSNSGTKASEISDSAENAAAQNIQETAPPSYDEMMNKDSATPFGEAARKQLFAQIYPAKAPRRLNDFSGLDLTGYHSAYGNLLGKLDLYKDSSEASRLFILEMYEAMNRDFESYFKTEGADNDVRMKLKIIQIKSDINSRVAAAKNNSSIK